MCDELVQFKPRNRPEISMRSLSESEYEGKLFDWVEVFLMESRKAAITRDTGLSKKGEYRLT
jgi:hypothetical protein